MTRFNVIMYSEQDSWLADKLSIRLKIEIIVRKSQYLPAILNIIGLPYIVLHLIWLICNRDCLECLVPIGIKHWWIVILTSTKHRPGVWAFIVGRSSLSNAIQFKVLLTLVILCHRECSTYFTPLLSLFASLFYGPLFIII